MKLVPRLSLVDALPLYLPTVHQCHRFLPGFVAAALESGTEQVLCTCRQFSFLTAEGVPPDSLIVRLRDMVEFGEVALSGEQAPQTIDIVVPTGELSSRVLFHRTLAEQRSIATELLEAAHSHGIHPEITIPGALTSPIEGTHVSAGRIVDASVVWKSRGVSRIRWEDGGECEPRMVENLSKTALSAGLTPEYFQFFFRNTDKYRASTSFAKALMLGSFQFVVLSGAARALPRRLDGTDVDEAYEWLAGTLAAGALDSKEGDFAVGEILQRRERACNLSIAASRCFWNCLSYMFLPFPVKAADSSLLLPLPFCFNDLKDGTRPRPVVGACKILLRPIARCCCRCFFGAVSDSSIVCGDGLHISPGTTNSFFFHGEQRTFALAASCNCRSRTYSSRWRMVLRISLMQHYRWGSH